MDPGDADRLPEVPEPGDGEPLSLDETPSDPLGTPHGSGLNRLFYFLVGALLLVSLFKALRR